MSDRDERSDGDAGDEEDARKKKLRRAREKRRRRKEREKERENGGGAEDDKGRGDGEDSVDGDVEMERLDRSSRRKARKNGRRRRRRGRDEDEDEDVNEKDDDEEEEEEGEEKGEEEDAEDNEGDDDNDDGDGDGAGGNDGGDRQGAGGRLALSHRERMMQRKREMPDKYPRVKVLVSMAVIFIVAISFASTQIVCLFMHACFNTYDPSVQAPETHAVVPLALAGIISSGWSQLASGAENFAGIGIGALLSLSYGIVALVYSIAAFAKAGDATLSSEIWNNSTMFPKQSLIAFYSTEDKLQAAIVRNLATVGWFWLSMGILSILNSVVGMAYANYIREERSRSLL